MSAQKKVVGQVACALSTLLTHAKNQNNGAKLFDQAIERAIGEVGEEKLAMLLHILTEATEYTEAKRYTYKLKTSLREKFGSNTALRDMIDCLKIEETAYTCVRGPKCTNLFIICYTEPGGKGQKRWSMTVAKENGMLECMLYRGNVQLGCGDPNKVVRLNSSSTHRRSVSPDFSAHFSRRGRRSYDDDYGDGDGGYWSEDSYDDLGIVDSDIEEEEEEDRHPTKRVKPNGSSGNNDTRVDDGRDMRQYMGLDCVDDATLTRTIANQFIDTIEDLIPEIMADTIFELQFAD